MLLEAFCTHKLSPFTLHALLPARICSVHHVTKDWILQVQEWQPYVWLYCQNENMKAEDVAEILPLLQYGGELVHLENVGRESHSFLQHITGHYHDLADYTLFSQDIPEAILVDRFEVTSFACCVVHEREHNAPWKPSTYKSSTELPLLDKSGTGPL